MATENRGRKPKVPNDVLDKLILEHKNEIISTDGQSK